MQPERTISNAARAGASRNAQQASNSSTKRHARSRPRTDSSANCLG